MPTIEESPLSNEKPEGNISSRTRARRRNMFQLNGIWMIIMAILNLLMGCYGSGIPIPDNLCPLSLDTDHMLRSISSVETLVDKLQTPALSRWETVGSIDLFGDQGIGSYQLIDTNLGTGEKSLDECKINQASEILQLYTNKQVLLPEIMAILGRLNKTMILQQTDFMKEKSSFTATNYKDGKLVVAFERSHKSRGVTWDESAVTALTEKIVKSMEGGFILLNPSPNPALGTQLIDPDVVNTIAKFTKDVFVPCLRPKLERSNYMRQALQAFKKVDPSLAELKRRVEALVANSTQPRLQHLDCIPVRAQLNIKSIKLDEMLDFNSMGFITFLKKLEKWKSRFVGQLKRFEQSERGHGEIFKSGSLKIYISQLFTESWGTKNLIIILHMCGATMFAVSVLFYCGTRKCIKDNMHHLFKLYHWLTSRTSQNQENQGYNLPPEQYQQPGYSQATASPDRPQSSSSIEMQDVAAPTRPHRRQQAITYQPQTYNNENSGYSGLSIT